MKKWLVGLLWCCGTLPALAQDRMLQEYLESGRLSEGRQAVQQALQAQPASQELRLQLALAQFFGTLERFSQNLHRMGLRSSWVSHLVPFLRFPVDENPHSEVATCAGLRQTLSDLQQGLNDTALTLSAIPDSWEGKVPLRFGRIRLDLNGDGQSREELWQVFVKLYGADISEKRAHQFGMRLDTGDVRWLEGYCHLLSALADVALAYDWHTLFDNTGHLFFRETDSPYRFLARTSEYDEILDVVAFFHLIQCPLQEPARMTSAHQHLQQVLALSRRSWDSINQEKDNDYEWIPNPRQRSVFPDWKVTPAMAKEWYAFLDEAQAILEGRRLLPFWRKGQPGQGVNFRRVFLEPRAFDLIQWLQGPGAAPFLEQGDVTPEAFWRHLSQTFGGQFMGFAAWFN